MEKILHNILHNQINESHFNLLLNLDYQLKISLVDEVKLYLGFLCLQLSNNM